MTYSHLDSKNDITEVDLDAILTYVGPKNVCFKAKSFIMIL